jgi:ParB family chromosome partitioning protein
MSFKSNLESKTLGILDDIKARKEKRALMPQEDADEKAFSTAPGRTGDLQDRKWLTNKVTELTAELERTRTSAASLEIPLDKLTEVPGRRRKLGEAEFAELRENLRRNPLVTPITVRPKDKGEYEIVSGHNRVRAYREIGRTSIAAVIQSADNTQASINAFYANLLQTDLSDYEKFIGFKMIQDELKLSQAKIAEHSGKSESFVSRLMAFQDLPEAALKIVDADPSIIGMDAAYHLAAIAKDATRKDAQAKVTEAIEKLAAKQIDQKQAVKLAASTDTAKPPAPGKPIKIKAGKADYCAMRRMNKVLRIEFKSQEEAEAIENAVRAVLENRAEQLKNAGK